MRITNEDVATKAMEGTCIPVAAGVISLDPQLGGWEKRGLARALLASATLIIAADLSDLASDEINTPVGTTVGEVDANEPNCSSSISSPKGRLSSHYISWKSSRIF